jgi:CBS domain-containing protein
LIGQELQNVKASALMTRPICSVARTASIADAAQLMSETGVGALTVVDNGDLVGIVTDRDIAIRAVGSGLPLEKPVSIIMTGEVLTCHEETELAVALETMARQQVRRMPVCNDYGSVIGMLSIGDIALHDPNHAVIAGTFLAICRPSALHGQVARVF